MSEQEQIAECKFCGSEGVFNSPCSACPGGPKRTEIKQYTLSELRSMSPEKREKVTQGDRPSGAAPRIVNLPGSDPR